MEQDKIDRINQLAKKAMENELTEAEKAERDILRREYIDGFKKNLTEALKYIHFADEPSKDNN